MWDSDFEDQEFHVPDNLVKTSGSVREEGAAATELAGVLRKLREALIQWTPDPQVASVPETAETTSDRPQPLEQRSVDQINQSETLNQSRETPQGSSSSQQKVPEYIVRAVSLVHGSLQDDTDEFYSSPAWKLCNQSTLQVSGDSFSDVLATANDCLHELQVSF